ncbi:hypothetical protein V2J09_002521 [Rumex salicifolius]
MAFPASLQNLSDDESQESDSQKQVKCEDNDLDCNNNGTPLKFLPLQHVYSTTAPCVGGSSSVVCKKVRARRLAMVSEDCLGDPCAPEQQQTPVVVFVRRGKGSSKASFFDFLVEKFEPPLKKRALSEVKQEPIGQDFDAPSVLQHKKRRVRAGEVAKLGIHSNGFCSPKGPKLREACNGRNASGKTSSILKRRKNLSAPVDHKQGINPRVYWPMDDEWYQGSVVAYDAESKRHNVKYDDGEEEDLMLSREKVKFYISNEQMLQLNLKPHDKSRGGNELDYSELLVLAASLDESRDHEPGDIIWAKLTGHAMWPAVIVDESKVSERKGMGKNPGGRSVPVQFFGTHDFARIQGKQIVSFLRGLLSSFHLKCKSPRFVRSLREAKIYLNEQKLPNNMLHLQCLSSTDEDEDHEEEHTIGSDEHRPGNDASKKALRGRPTTPLTFGDLQILNFGEIIRDSVYFQDDKSAWPLGYTSERKLSSMRDSSLPTIYKMEVLRDPESKIRPLFRVTVDGEQFKGASPSACWNKIFKRMGDMQNDVTSFEGGAVKINESGSEMFGFTNPEVLKIIKDMSVAKVSSKTTTDRIPAQRFENMPAGYRPVRIDWKDLDRCSVCHMDEEYETNLFLQCDKCRIMVHARCYGEVCADDVLWFCNLCRPGAPESTPPCCLCPVVGGAMKPTSDGRWAHLSCAIWIPETCLYDIKRMEPIDGINRINRDRWKLLCCICGVSYGACIQCSNSTCRVSYHPLCARAAGLCVELEDEDRLHLLPMDEDEEDQCIRLLSFCKKHKPLSNGCPNLDERVEHIASQYSSYTPPLNPSGCARCEPYDYFGRRGRKEPEVLAAASVKRLFLKNEPYLVSGYCLHESLMHMSSGDEVLAGSKFSPDLQKDQNCIPGSQSVHSMAEKYECMRQTFRKRLAFGKSRIHGFGIFTKQPHKAGDMVIEYTGEVVRPSVADRREHLIYNSLVGAGTYMFRIDNERVIDATRAGSIAHLINHSCEPNCYSRVITVNGDEHIIIFAKRDIKQWEELTYDYRFFSIDERLPCYCGFQRCRGVVNDVEAEEQLAKLHAPRSELVN